MNEQERNEKLERARALLANLQPEYFKWHQIYHKAVRDTKAKIKRLEKGIDRCPYCGKEDKLDK